MIVAAPERERPRRSAEAIKNGKLRHRSLWLAIRKALTIGSDCCKVSFLCNFGFRVGLLHFFTHWNLSSSGKISPELRRAVRTLGKSCNFRQVRLLGGDGLHVSLHHIANPPAASRQTT